MTGAAGEYFVAAELSRRRWAATVTPRGAPETDVLAQHLDTGVLIAVQVKTVAAKPSGAPHAFRLRPDVERAAPARDKWFAFVGLPSGEQERPSFYLVPSDAVSAYAYIRHRLKLREAAEAGRHPKEEPGLRQVHPDDIAQYHERWDLLLQPADELPHLLPDWVFEAAHGQVGLPPGHPGLRPPEKIPEAGT